MISIYYAERLGKRSVFQLKSAGGIYFRRGKQRVSRYSADGTRLFIHLSALTKNLFLVKVD